MGMFFLVYLILLIKVLKSLPMPKRIDFRDSLIIVPGARLYDGIACQMLQDRLQYLTKVDLANVEIIVSGGVDSNEVLSEAEVMKMFLEDLGIKNKIIIEPKAVSTTTNIKNSIALINVDKYDNIYVLSNRFHISRIKMICNKYCPQAQYIGIESINLQKTILREPLAYMKTYIELKL